MRSRLGSVPMYQHTKDVGVTCRRYGLSLPVLCKWWQRFQEHSEQGARCRSRGCKRPPSNITAEREWIFLRLGRERHLGSKSLQGRMDRYGYGPRLSTAMT